MQVVMHLFNFSLEDLRNLLVLPRNVFLLLVSFSIYVSDPLTSFDLLRQTENDFDEWCFCWYFAFLSFLEHYTSIIYLPGHFYSPLPKFCTLPFQASNKVLFLSYYPKTSPIIQYKLIQFSEWIRPTCLAFCKHSRSILSYKCVHLLTISSWNTGNSFKGVKLQEGHSF